MALTRAIPSLLVCYGLVAGAPAPEGPKRLSLQEAIQTSLENNLQVQVARETREISRGNVVFNEGSFDWNLGAAYSQSHSENDYSDSTANSRSLKLSLSRPFEWGGSFSLGYTPSYSSSRVPNLGGVLSGTGGASTPYSAGLSLSYVQPLLRNFGRETSESALIVARKGAQQADLTFQKSIIDLVANTESLYWDVVYAQRNLDNKKQALALAKKQLKENQIRVEVGTLAPIEVTSAEAAVAQKEQEIIAAEAQLLNAKDALLRALYPTSERPSGLELTDAPSIKPLDLEETAAEKLALDHRVELKSARLDVESKQVLETAARNRLKPQLDLGLSYSGAANSYTALGPANTDIAKSKIPTYGASLTFSLPIANRAAKGTEIQARANRRSSELTLHDLELGIVLEVRQALRNLDASEKGVKAAEKTRIFREKNLEAEQKKFENGMSTNFFVLQRQDELDQARSSELQAQITYAKAVTSLEKAVGNLLEARKLEVR
ncbi:MAG: TolC family protein [Holophagaceae bacterium]